MSEQRGLGWGCKGRGLARRGGVGGLGSRRAGGMGRGSARARDPSGMAWLGQGAVLRGAQSRGSGAAQPPQAAQPECQHLAPPCPALPRLTSICFSSSGSMKLGPKPSAPNQGWKQGLVAQRLGLQCFAGAQADGTRCAQGSQTSASTHRGRRARATLLEAPCCSMHGAGRRQRRQPAHRPSARLSSPPRTVPKRVLGQGDVRAARRAWRGGVGGGMGGGGGGWGWGVGGGGGLMSVA